MPNLTRATTSLLGLALLLLATHADAQSKLYEISGANQSDYLGQSVSAAGDVNRDGRADVIIGVYGDDSAGLNAGSARVISGADGSVLFEALGPTPGAWLGYSVSGAGDVNGDGYDDVLVGAPGSGTVAGRARVLSGVDGSLLYDLIGPTTAGSFGWSVSGAGDMNGDGRPDVIVGMRWGDFAVVYSGLDGTILYELHGGSDAGSAVSGAGDVNADGYADVIVGAPNTFDYAQTGSAQVFSGKDGSGLLGFVGDGGAWIWFGYSVGAAGDVNADGFDDVIIGSPSDELARAAGSARVFSGKDGALLHLFMAASHDDFKFGEAVAGVGDVNGDGFDDVAVNVRDDGYIASAPGSVRVYSGLDGSALATFSGSAPGERFGRSVSAAGDVNGDLRPDLIIGAIGKSTTASFAGAALVVPCCDFLGESTCTPSVSNSTGTPGSLTVTGSDLVADNDVTLTGASLPTGRIALFLASRGAVDPQVPLFGSQGFLCLRPPLGRFAAQTQATGADGLVSIRIDLDDIPNLGAVLPGSTWYFQCFYRDVNPTATSNLSDAIGVSFE